MTLQMNPGNGFWGGRYVGMIFSLWWICVIHVPKINASIQQWWYIVIAYS